MDLEPTLSLSLTEEAAAKIASKEMTGNNENALESVSKYAARKTVQVTGAIETNNLTMGALFITGLSGSRVIPEGVTVTDGGFSVIAEVTYGEDEFLILQTGDVVNLSKSLRENQALIYLAHTDGGK